MIAYLSGEMDVWMGVTLATRHILNRLCVFPFFKFHKAISSRYRSTAEKLQQRVDSATEAAGGWEQERAGLREALAAAKARGVRLGNPRGAAALRRAGLGGAPLRRAVSDNADAHARALAPLMGELKDLGFTSLRAIAAELDSRGILTRRGGGWHVSTVRNLIARIDMIE
jgi:hypothetical protein